MTDTVSAATFHSSPYVSPSDQQGWRAASRRQRGMRNSFQDGLFVSNCREPGGRANGERNTFLVALLQGFRLVASTSQPCPREPDQAGPHPVSSTVGGDSRRCLRQERTPAPAKPEQNVEVPGELTVQRAVLWHNRGGKRGLSFHRGSLRRRCRRRPREGKEFAQSHTALTLSEASELLVFRFQK